MSERKIRAKFTTPRSIKLFKILGIFTFLVIVGIGLFNAKTRDAQALALCSELSEPVGVFITLDGTTYSNEGGASLSISAPAGHQFNFSWDTQHDIDDTTNGGYYAAHPLGGWHIVSGSGVTDPLPASGTLNLINVYINVRCSGGSGSIDGSLSINVTVSGGGGGFGPTVDVDCGSGSAGPGNDGPCTIPSSGSAPISWLSIGGQAPVTCTASGDWGGGKATSGSFTANGLSPGTYLYTLTCVDSQNRPGDDSVRIDVTEPPTVLITADPQTLPGQGYSTTILYTPGGNPDNCQASASPPNAIWNGPVPDSSNGQHSQVIVAPNINVTTTFTITCYKTGHPSASASVQVVVQTSTPDFSLYCSPPSSSVPQGGGASYGATVVGSGGFSSNVNFSVSITNLGNNPNLSPTVGSAPTGGVFTTGATTTSSTTTGTYLITFRGDSVSPALTRFCSSQLDVYSGGSPPPTASITANPTTVVSGSSSTLTWSSANATACTASANPANAQWSGSVALSGSKVITNITQNTIFTIVCSGPGIPSPATSNVTVNASGVPTYTVTINNTPKNYGSITGNNGVNCTVGCVSQVITVNAGTSVTMTASPASGFGFANWTGDCASTSTTCNLININANKTVTGTFNTDNGSGSLLTITSISPNPADGLTTVSGTVRAAGKPSGTQCTTPVTKYFRQPASMTGWSVAGGPTGSVTTFTQTNAGVDGAIGSCIPVYVPTQYNFSFDINTAAMSNNTYTVTVNATGYTGAFSGTGSFSVSHPQTLNVSRGGLGNGSVTGSSNPAQADINCGTTCSLTYSGGTVVTLTASPLAGSAFSSWTGCDSAVGTSCTVTMNAVKNVIANFALIACPAGSVNLASTSINITETTTASASAGFFGGTFVSSDTNRATVSGTTITGQGGSSIGNRPVISGTGWSNSNGAVNCSLTGSSLTVKSFTVSVSATPNPVNAGSSSAIIVRITGTEGGTMPVNVTMLNGNSTWPTGWLFSPTSQSGNAGVAPGTQVQFLLLTNASAETRTFKVDFNAAFNWFTQPLSIDMTVNPPIPGQPATVTASNIICSRINISWTAPTTGGAVAGYRVYRDPTPSSPPNPSVDSDWVQIPSPSPGGDLPATVFSYGDSAPVNPTGSNYYAVAAFNSSGVSSKRQPSPAAITPFPCKPNFTGSDKDIIALNGVGISGASACSGETEQAGLPSAFKSGDTVKFQVNLCNSTGKLATTNLTVIDTMTNMTYKTNSFLATGTNPCGIESFVPSSTTLTVQIEPELTFGSNPGSTCQFTFEAIVTDPAQGADQFEFQNVIEIRSTGLASYFFRTLRYAALRTPLDPKKQETN